MHKKIVTKPEELVASRKGDRVNRLGVATILKLCICQAHRNTNRPWTIGAFKNIGQKEFKGRALDSGTTKILYKNYSPKRVPECASGRFEQVIKIKKKLTLAFGHRLC